MVPACTSASEFYDLFIQELNKQADARQNRKGHRILYSFCLNTLIMVLGTCVVSGVTRTSSVAPSPSATSFDVKIQVKHMKLYQFVASAIGMELKKFSSKRCKRI